MMQRMRRLARRKTPGPPPQDLDAARRWYEGAADAGHWREFAERRAGSGAKWAERRRKLWAAIREVVEAVLPWT
jgi:hypothetical protein